MSYSAAANMAAFNAQPTSAAMASGSTAQSSLVAQVTEAALVSAPVASLTLAAGAPMMDVARVGGEAMLAHYLAVMLAGSSYGMAKDGYFSTSSGKEVEVAAATGGLLGAWVYWSRKDTNIALKSALLAAAGSYVGARYLVPAVRKYTS